MKRIWLYIFAFLLFENASAQDLKPFDLTEDWISKITAIAPSQPAISTDSKKNMLIFSLHTGFEHWTIPHTEAVIKIIAEKSDGFNITTSKDISVFEAKNLKKYDAVVLNNNCSIGDKRDLFWDVIKADSTLTTKQQLKKARKLENNLLKYVKKGNGLMVLHGAIVMQNNSMNFSKAIGGSFDYHPKQQKIDVKLVDPAHPMVQAFNGEGFSHVDEPYFFHNAYFNYNFRPLLYMDAKQLEGMRSIPEDNIKYIAWIKKHGKGRVFYCSPSHNAQSYENPDLLQFLLDGMQYVTGQISCDESPIGVE